MVSTSMFPKSTPAVDRNKGVGQKSFFVDLKIPYLEFRSKVCQQICSFFLSIKEPVNLCLKGEREKNIYTLNGEFMFNSP